MMAATSGSDSRRDFSSICRAAFSQFTAVPLSQAGPSNQTNLLVRRRQSVGRHGGGCGGWDVDKRERMGVGSGN